MKIDRDAAWKTIVGYYSRPGVAEDLLRQQQESDLDIVLFLFLRYLSEELHLTIPPALRSDAEHCVAAWRNVVIKPTRALRRRLKDMPGLEAIDDSRHEFRESLKQIELQAERVEFNSLCNWLEARSATVSRT